MNELQWFDNPDGLGHSELLQLEGEYRLDSLLCAVEEDLQSKEAHSASARVFLGVCALEREVHNGGFEQFFSNSSSEYASEVVDALRRIGSVKIEKIAQEALQCLGAKPEWREDEFFDAVEDPSEEVERKLSALDEMYFAARQGEDLEAMQWKFLTEHTDEF